MILHNPLSLDEPNREMTALALSGAIVQYTEGWNIAEAEEPRSGPTILPDESLYED